MNVVVLIDRQYLGAPVTAGSEIEIDEVRGRDWIDRGWARAVGEQPADIQLPLGNGELDETDTTPDQSDDEPDLDAMSKKELLDLCEKEQIELPSGRFNATSLREHVRSALEAGGADVQDDEPGAETDDADTSGESDQEAEGDSGETEADSGTGDSAAS